MPKGLMLRINLKVIKRDLTISKGIKEIAKI
jgi:hypothetical protein